MARALIVGCGCRGRELGTLLVADGWQVRGTTRADRNWPAMIERGIEPVIADPDRAGTILEAVADVTVVVWALGSATGPPELVEAVNGPRLERVLEHLVDTPVRGFVYEASGSAPAGVLARGAAAVRGAGERWRIPVEVLDEPPGDHEAWARAAAGAAARLISPR